MFAKRWEEWEVRQKKAARPGEAMQNKALGLFLKKEALEEF